MRAFQTRLASRLLCQSSLNICRTSRRSFADNNGSINHTVVDDDVEPETSAFSLEAKVAALELRDKRRAAARKGQATRLARKRAAELATTLPHRVGNAALEPHTDLSSYLEHAARNNVKTTTTVYKGTVYEYTVARALKQYGMELRRVGRANDYGIDLIGKWVLPEGRDMRVFLQCKLTKTMPAFVRELEGAYAGAPAGWDNDEVLAILSTRHPATPGVQQAIQRSKLPLAIAQIDTDGSIRQLIWNHVASGLGLAQAGVTTLHNTTTDLSTGPNVTLTWQGRQWPVSS